jgi:hypothetical protein
MRRSRSARKENLAIFLLLAGSLLFGLGWLLGVLLAWTSRIWTVRDKVIATLCPPGGFLPAIWLVFLPGPDDLSPLARALLVAAAAILAVMPFATAFYLHARLRPRALAPA